MPTNEISQQPIPGRLLFFKSEYFSKYLIGLYQNYELMKKANDDISTLSTLRSKRTKIYYTEPSLRSRIRRLNQIIDLPLNYPYLVIRSKSDPRATHPDALKSRNEREYDTNTII